jgi:hypothetical protein
VSGTPPGALNAVAPGAPRSSNAVMLEAEVLMQKILLVS